MADKTFKLEIVTPTKVVFRGDVVSFTAPGVMGSFQVLHNHAPMLAEIGIGTAKLRDANGTEIVYATSGGFVDVLKNQVIMLAETIEISDEIDIPRAESSGERARQQLADKLSESDREEINAALNRASNRIRIAEKR
ncbi:MAG: ATP synthase F1 subunit epsilon [Bacteroidota bacterium]|nr:ATP synthase F1 subunit epsilon [Bacteroidota bacterium]